MNIYDQAVNQAVSELKGIEAQLTALLSRRDQLRKFVEHGRSLYPNEDSASPIGASDGVASMADPMVLQMPTRSRTRQGLTAKDRIINGAKRQISEFGPQSTSAIIAAVEADGVEIGGADKVLNVSSILSRAKDIFKSDRAAGGWTLVTPHKEENPTDVSPSAGS